MSSSEEKTPTVSPDQGTTGETTKSSENKETGTQTGLSEEEKEAHLDQIECNAIMGMMNSLKARNPEAYQDIIIETLYKQFARENRATRSKETRLHWRPIRSYSSDDPQEKNLKLSL